MLFSFILPHLSIHPPPIFGEMCVYGFCWASEPLLQDNTNTVMIGKVRHGKVDEAYGFWQDKGSLLEWTSEPIALTHRA